MAFLSTGERQYVCPCIKASLIAALLVSGRSLSSRHCADCTPAFWKAIWLTSYRHLPSWEVFSLVAAGAVVLWMLSCSLEPWLNSSGDCQSSWFAPL